MEKTTIYVIALVVGGILGIISTLSRKKGKTSGHNSGSKDNFADKSEEEKLREFAQHHFNELQKLNPNLTLNNNTPESVFPKILKDALQPKKEDVGYRVTVEGSNINICNMPEVRYGDVEINPVFLFEKEIPELRIYEDGELLRTFVIEPKDTNPNLKGQYFHSSVRINSNSSVQIDGYISNNASSFGKDNEGIRFQPFFLSDRDHLNKKLRGKGMFQRGLHYNGIISSGDMRLICICDSCLKSFSVGFYHAGFSELQYFYSSNSKETLLVPYYSEVVRVPHQLEKEIDDAELKEIESKLPATFDGRFEYYNSFKCPHCNYDYINFRENKDIRPNEYYVNFYLNKQPRRIN